MKVIYKVKVTWRDEYGKTESEEFNWFKTLTMAEAFAEKLKIGNGGFVKTEITESTEEENAEYERFKEIKKEYLRLAKKWGK